MQWNDGRIGWNPDDFSGLETFPVPEPWSHGPALIEAIDSKAMAFSSSTKAAVGAGGQVALVMNLHSQTPCQPNYQAPYEFRICPETSLF